MEIFFLSLTIMNSLFLVESKLEIGKLINHEGMKCDEELEPKGQCYEVIYGEEINETLNLCSKEGNKTYCSLNYKEGSFPLGKCEKIKKFYGEKCENNFECFSNKCSSGKCDYISPNEKCNIDKDCGLKYYCGVENEDENKDESDKKCLPYQINLNDSCEKYRCSPKYFCNKDKKCVEKGTIEGGKPAENKLLCKSFYRVNGLCVDKCDEKDIGCKIDLEILQTASDFCRNLNLDKKKYSDFYGDNCGSFKSFNISINSMKYDPRVKYFSQDEWECIKQTFTEIFTIADYKQGMGVKWRFTLTDEDVKNILGTKSSSVFFIKVSLAFSLLSLFLF